MELSAWAELEDADDATFIKNLVLDKVSQLWAKECEEHTARAASATDAAKHQAQRIALEQSQSLRIQAVKTLWAKLSSGDQAPAVASLCFPFVDVSSVCFTEFSFVHGPPRTYKLARFSTSRLRAHIVHLAGENGAGKSSLMLGLQLGLTGGVRGISRPSGDDLSEFINQDLVDALADKAHASVDVEATLHADPPANLQPQSFRVGASTDATLTARDLFAHLRVFDKSSCIAAMTDPEDTLAAVQPSLSPCDVGALQCEQAPPLPLLVDLSSQRRERRACTVRRLRGGALHTRHQRPSSQAALSHTTSHIGPSCRSCLQQQEAQDCTGTAGHTCAHAGTRRSGGGIPACCLTPGPVPPPHPTGMGRHERQQ